MTAMNNLLGKRFGRLTVIERDFNSKYAGVRWICKCVCGNIKSIAGPRLTAGSQTKSCGCILKELRPSINRTHGKSTTVLYKLYMGIKRRCYNKNEKRYLDYGGRGITMCAEWFNSFEAFLEWATPIYVSGLAIDRIDNSKGYSPENCRFTTRQLNSCNRRVKSTSSSGFSGVNFNKLANAWVARISFKNSRYFVGSFKTKEEAVQARNEYITKNNLPHPLQELK